MVKVLIGNIFESKAQTLVNTVNTVGVMGKGLALEFKKRFPEMFKDYADRCKRGEVRLGRPYLYIPLLPPYILLFPTKEDWRSVSRLSAIEEGLEHIKQNYKSWGITSIAVPPLGCGLGELDWSIVGPTLYRHLSELDIPVEMFAPFETPHSQLTPEYLGEISEAQRKELHTHTNRIDPGFIPTLEVLWRLQNKSYSWPVGRTTFQKIAYFATLLGFRTGLTYRRGSFGPFSPELKSKLTALVNNGLIEEERAGKMFVVRVGRTYMNARKLFESEFSSQEPLIERLTDLFSRTNTKQAEIAATVHFAWKTMKKPASRKPSEVDVLNEVMEWKKRHRPPYDREEIAATIRNLAVLRWLDVEPGEEISKELDALLEI